MGWPTKQVKRLLAGYSLLGNVFGIFKYRANWFAAHDDGLEWMGLADDAHRD